MENRMTLLVGGAVALATANIGVLLYLAALGWNQREERQDDLRTPLNGKPNKEKSYPLRYKRQKEHFDRETHEWKSRDEEEEPDEEAKEAINKLLFIVKIRFDQPEDPPDIFVRVKSTPLLSCLRAAMKEVDEVHDSEPLIHTHDLFRARSALKALTGQMQSQLLELEGKGGDSAEPSVRDPAEDPARVQLDEEDRPLSRAEIEGRLDHLKVMLDFLDKDFAHTRDRLDRLSKDDNASFPELWALFVPGEIAVCDHEDTGEEQAFVIKSVAFETSHTCGRYLSIAGHFIEHTGSKWQRTWMSTKVIKFKDRGKLYAELTGVNYREYIGSLIDITYEVTGQKRIEKKRADGRVMVDRQSYRRMQPSGYGNGRTPQTWEELDWDDDLSCPCASCMSKAPQDIFDEDLTNGSPSHEQTAVPAKDLLLLPSYVFAFSFALKSWGLLTLEGFKEVQFAVNAFDHLVLEAQHKLVIKALVESTNKEGKLISDIIAGKGGGVIILLHGPPGSGKTLTAESVAEHLKRPLYTVSAGALGDSAERVERSLHDTLEIAANWSAILLIDEADVFLEERGDHELARNALVAVFLRMLEYHSGLLILTSNRVKSFDAAFASRFSVAIRYRELSYPARKSVWRKFLQMAGCEVATSKTVSNGIVGDLDTPPNSTPPSPPDAGLKRGHISEKELSAFAETALNGRVIKQLVRAAMALAMSEDVALNASHLAQVLAFQRSFAEDLDSFANDMYDAADGSTRSGRPRASLYG